MNRLESPGFSRGEDVKADEPTQAIGLSIGATNLAAVTVGRALTRRPVLTLFPHRAPEVGVPSENPALDEAGLVIGDFVERVADPIGMVATDGSVHHADALLATGLAALARTATGGRRTPAAVTYPGHWGPAAVAALRAALNRLPDFADGPVLLISDVAAALIALQASLCMPARGTVAVCDVGGSGTSITVVDAANDYHPVGATVRHPGFSGDLIDQLLLTHVVSALAAARARRPADNPVNGSLAQLRSQCRDAKERLTAAPVTELDTAAPGCSPTVSLRRSELDSAIRQPLDRLAAAVHEAVDHTGTAAELVAVASVGGAANIPAVTTALADALAVPVITTPRPQLTAATGAALRVARGPAPSAVNGPV